MFIKRETIFKIFFKKNFKKVTQFKKIKSFKFKKSKYISKNKFIDFYIWIFCLPFHRQKVSNQICPNLFKQQGKIELEKNPSLKISFFFVISLFSQKKRIE